MTDGVHVKPYPEYKDSGVEWLGDVPAHWTMKRVKHVCTIDNSGAWGDEPEKTADPSPVATTAQIDPDGRFRVQDMPVRSFTKAEKIRYTCKDGDVLVVKSSGSATNVISGKVGLVGPNEAGMVFSNFLLRLRPRRETVRARHLYRFLASGIIRERIRLMVSTTTYPNLKVAEYTGFELPLPPLPEQEKIAAFLDYETGRMDLLIEKQEKLIELLKEKRQAVISHAVTKGLNPDAPMKDSGVEWLGEVPEHWGLRRIKHIFTIRKRIIGRIGPPVLSVTQRGLKEKDIVSGEGQLSMDYSKYQEVHVGDFAMNHMDLLTGFVDIAEQYGVTSPDYRVFALTARDCCPEYMLACLQMGYLDRIFYSFGQGAATVGRWRLPSHAFNNYTLTIPPLSEQVEIAAFLAKEKDRMDSLVHKAKSQIELIRERRTALISAAVTGKIDLSDWRAPREEAA